MKMKVDDEGGAEGDFGSLRGFDERQTKRWTDICECRVTFATEKLWICCAQSLSTLVMREHSTLNSLLACMKNDKDWWFRDV